LDQPGQCYAHRVVEIGVGEATVSNPLKELAMFAAIRRASS
jgi:hypothetical protein